MKIFLMTSICFLLFISCSDDNKTTEQNEDTTQTKFINKIYPYTGKIDYSTPDNLIKSFWKFIAWKDTIDRRDTTAYVFLSDGFKSLANKNHSENMDQRRKIDYNLQYKIDRVEIQSESRAIVYTKQLEYSSAEKLTNFKYVLSRVGNKWMIDEYLSECFACDGTGKSYGSACKYCKGLGYEPVLWF